MKTNRRKFISTAVVGGLAATTLPISSCSLKSDSTSSKIELQSRYDKLDEILKLPVLKRELFPNPVIIDTIELLRDRNNFLCRVRSKDGAEGISAGHGSQNKTNWPVFNTLIRMFSGKDARDLDKLIPDPHGKQGGIPFNVQLATLEIAILDMLGNLANKPIAALLGEIVHPRIEVYQGSRMSELLSLPVEESLAIVKQDLLESKAKAVKMRVGLPGQLDMDSKAGNEKLIKTAREMFGDKMILGCDGNNKFTAAGAIRMGKILEEYNYQWWEEMVPFGWYDELKQVHEALKIKVYSGESESHMSTFRWLVANNAVSTVQPDQLYFGGLIRSIRVARMAAEYGIEFVPHVTQYGLGYLYMLHCVAVCPNAGKYQEFDLFSTRDANGNQIPIQSKTTPITSEDGVLPVPTGSGLGIIIDPDYIKAHKVVTEW
jgi:L-alanine-DL-glutamate epimerase-like enolase superfamily enzyme